MTEYIIKASQGLISLAFMITLFSFISHGKGKERMRYISGIIMTVYIIKFVSPLIKTTLQTDFSAILGDTSDSDVTESDEPLLKAIAAQICKEIKQLAANRFALSESDFAVNVTVDKNQNDEIVLQEIVIRFTDPQKAPSESEVQIIANYISDTLAAPCTILIESNNL